MNKHIILVIKHMSSSSNREPEAEPRFSEWREGGCCLEQSCEKRPDSGGEVPRKLWKMNIEIAAFGSDFLFFGG